MAVVGPAAFDMTGVLLPCVFAIWADAEAAKSAAAAAVAIDIPTLFFARLIGAPLAL
ncbi:MAG: hypothetical protein WBF58_00020 [Xanthobacteraceae bacterium]